LLKEEKTGSEVVNVVKPYHTTFALVETPVLDDGGMELNILFSLFLLLLLLRLQKEKLKV
jgi:hypothetical protein